MEGASIDTIPYDEKEITRVEQEHDDLEEFFTSVSCLSCGPPVHYYEKYAPYKDNEYPCMHDDEVEVEFDHVAASQLVFYNQDLHEVYQNGGSLVARWSSQHHKWHFLVDRDLHILTKEEEKQFVSEVMEAKTKELRAWVDLEAFIPLPRACAKNLISGR